MKNAHQSRSELLETLHQVSSQFTHAHGQMQKRETRLNDLLDKLRTSLSVASQKASNQVQTIGKTPMAHALSNFIQSIGSANEQWQRSVAAFDRQTEFRAGFGDSLLVFVYGKVKAGKSSLGNYIAWGHSDVTEATKANHPGPLPRFDTHVCSHVKGGDSHNEAKSTSCFKVGQLETTSSIQSFTLPGFTWVDSPGLHSTNAANGELAKSYVQAADLIVYAMESQNPGRASDLAEITELLNGHKNLIVVLTRSDAMVEDENENGEIVAVLEMKSKHDRDSQISYVMGEIGKLPNHANIIGKALPVSVKYAERHGENSEKFADSGMAAFMQELQRTAHGDSLRLKQETPQNNLKSFLGKLQQSTEVLQKNLLELKNSMSEQQRELNEARLVSIQEVKLAMESEVRKALELHQGDSKGMQQYLNKKLTEHSAQALKTNLENVFKKMDASLQRYLNVEGVKELPGFEERFHEARKPKGEMGSAIGSTTGGAIGAAIGTIFGPGVGTLAGAAIGGYVGKKIGSLFDDDESTVQVPIGDNSEQVASEAYTAYARASEQTIDIAFQKITGPFHTSLQALLDDTQKALTDFTNNIPKVLA